jgi:hypothetical protein
LLAGLRTPPTVDTTSAHPSPASPHHHQDEEDTYDAIVDNWVLSRTASLEQQVAGLRLLHACLDCWLFRYPLTEDSLVEKLGYWALAGISAQQQQQQQQPQQPPTIMGDPPPASLNAFLEEAKATYALGECVQQFLDAARALSPAFWLSTCSL